MGEGGLKPEFFIHGLGRGARKGWARPKARGGNPCRKAALIGKPLESISDARSINSTGTDARNEHAQIIAVESCCVRSYRPSSTTEDPARKHHESWPIFNNEPTLKWPKPSLENYKKRKCPLDRRSI